jgi:hypothetical protein
LLAGAGAGGYWWFQRQANTFQNNVRSAEQFLNNTSSVNVIGDGQVTPLIRPPVAGRPVYQFNNNLVTDDANGGDISSRFIGTSLPGQAPVLQFVKRRSSTRKTSQSTSLKKRAQIMKTRKRKLMRRKKRIKIFNYLDPKKPKL